jgi:hypothetical protein
MRTVRFAAQREREGILLPWLSVEEAFWARGIR